MKENRLFDAVGQIDDCYIDEAQDGALAATAHRRHIRRQVLLVAALIAAALCAMGFTMAGRLYFAPGVGIVDNESITAPQVWACYDEISLGGTKIDAVVLSEGEEGYTLTIWVWREKEVEQDPEQAKQGIPPKALDLSLLIDGTEYTRGSNSMATSGFSTYSFIEIPFTTMPVLRDNAGNEAVVSLKAINESQYAHLKGISFGDNLRLSIVPVSGSENVLAAQLTDPLSADIAKFSADSYAVGNFITIRGDGEQGHASGTLAINTASINALRGIQASKQDYGKGLTSISLCGIDVNHKFSIHNDSLPRVTITVPTKGEGYDCNEVLLDSGGVVCRLTRVEFGENGLQYTVETDNHTGSTIIQDIRGYVTWAYSMGEFNYSYSDGTSVHYDVWPRMVSYQAETGELSYSPGHTDAEIFRVPVQPGDKLAVILDSLTYSYVPDSDPQATFGTIQIR